jgi:hypothetical protein
MRFIHTFVYRGPDSIRKPFEGYAMARLATGWVKKQVLLHTDVDIRQHDGGMVASELPRASTVKSRRRNFESSLTQYRNSSFWRQ